jgi:hypothetical protein
MLEFPTKYTITLSAAAPAPCPVHLRSSHLSCPALSAFDYHRHVALSSFTLVHRRHAPLSLPPALGMLVVTPLLDFLPMSMCMEIFRARV